MKIELRRYTLAIISIALLVCGIYSSDKQYADALSQIDVTVAGTQNAVDFIDRHSSGTPCRVFSLTLAQKINVVNCDNHTVVTNNGTLGTTGTACQSATGIASCNLGTGTFSGMECSRFFCFVRFNNATHELLVRYTHASGFTQVTGWFSNGLNFVIDIDAMESFSSTGGDATVWFVHSCGADTDRIIAIINGASMLSSGTVDNKLCTDASGTEGNLGANSGNDLITVISGVTRYLAVSTDQAVNNFRIFRLDTNDFVCMFSGATSNQLTYDNTNTEFLLIQNAVSGDVVRIENNASCTNNGTITDATLGTTGFTLRSGDVIEGRSEIYITSSNSKVIAVNNTSYGKAWEYALTGDNLDVFAIEAFATELATVPTGSTIRFIIISGTATSPTTTVCIDTNPLIDVVDLLCITDTNADGIPDVTGNQVARVNQNLTTSTFTILCQVGLANCTNTNIQTNGVGIMLLLFLIVLTIGIIMAITMKTQHDVSEIHPLLWLTVIFVDVAGAWYFDWIEDIIFYGLLVVFIGLGAFGVYRHLRDSG